MGRLNKHTSRETKRIVVYAQSTKRVGGFKTVVDYLFQRQLSNYKFLIISEDTETWRLSTPTHDYFYVKNPHDFREVFKALRPDGVIIWGCFVQLINFYSYVPETLVPQIHFIVFDTLDVPPSILRSLERSDLILTVSEWSRSLLPMKASIVPLGVDTQLFKPRVIEEEKPTFVFGSVSTPWFRKFNDRTIRAYAKFKSKYKLDSIHLYMHTEPEGRLQAPLLFDVMLKYRVNIEFPHLLTARVGASRRALAFTFNLFDVHCLASTESFGLPYLEAMASGVPNIAIDAGNARELLCDCGLLVPWHEYLELREGAVPLIGIDAYADAMETYYTDEELRLKHREAGLKKAKHYTWERSRQALKQALDKFFV